MGFLNKLAPIAAMKLIQKIVFRAVVYSLCIVLALFLGDWILGKTKYSNQRKVFLDKGDKRAIMLPEPRPGMDAYFRPDPLELERTSRLPDKEFKLQADEHGFWLPSGIHEYPDLTIYFLGGSTTACTYNAGEKRFVYLSGLLLDERLDEKVNTYNAAYNSINSGHSINILFNKVIGRNPDYVVMMHACNDLGFLSKYGTYFTDDAKWLSPVKKLPTPRRPKGAVWQLWQALFPNLNQVYVDRSARKTAQAEAKEIKLSDEEMARHFANNLEMFIAMCRQYGVEPILMTQGHKIASRDKETMAFFEALMNPNYSQSTPLSFEHWLKLERLFNETIRMVASDKAVNYIDLEKGLEGRYEMFYDPIHLTEEGSETVAGIIADSMQRFVQVPVPVNSVEN